MAASPVSNWQPCCSAMRASPVSGHSLVHFADAQQVGGFAQQALAWANGNGIMSGKGEGIFVPQVMATRAQVAQMPKNFVEKAQ